MLEREEEGGGGRRGRTAWLICFKVESGGICPAGLGLGRVGGKRGRVIGAWSKWRIGWMSGENGAKKRG